MNLLGRNSRLNLDSVRTEHGQVNFREFREKSTIKPMPADLHLVDFYGRFTEKNGFPNWPYLNAILA